MIWNPLWGEEDQKHHSKANVKRDAFKNHTKRIGILHWIIFYRKESCGLNPWLRHESQPPSHSLVRGWGGLTSQPGLTVQDGQLLKVFWRWLKALPSLYSLWAKSCDLARERVKVSATDHQAFTVDENCQLACWVVQSVSMTSPVCHYFGEKRKNHQQKVIFWMETSLVWF